MREPLAALRAIDEEMSGRPFVLTCRTAEFQEANAGSVLHQVLIVDLLRLRAEEVRDILLDYEPAPAQGPLSTYVAALEADPTGPVADALDTPLMVSLARQSGASMPDLRAVPAGPDGADVIRQHLLGTFVRKAYANDDEITRAQARHYLRFLARHTDGAARIAWWMLYETVPQAVFLVVAIVNAVVICAGLVALFFALFKNPWLGFWVGLGAGVVGAVIDTLAPHQAPRRARPRFRSIKVPAPNELVRILVFGVRGGAALSVIVWALYGPARYIVIGGVLSAVTYATASYIGQPSDPLKVITPRSLLSGDRMTVMYAWLLAALAGALIGSYLGPYFRTGHRPRFDSLALLHNTSPALTLLGAACGCVLSGAGLGLMEISSSSWGRFVFTRLWLASRGSAPLRLMSFLDDACARGILRQTNGYYEFRHQLLQRYLGDPHPGLATGAPGALASPAAPP
jgi:hypothetical protein